MYICRCKHKCVRVIVLYKTLAGKLNQHISLLLHTLTHSLANVCKALQIVYNFFLLLFFKKYLFTSLYTFTQ